MRIESIQHQLDQGWSTELPDMDSENTVVFVFGAPEYQSEAKVFEELKEKYPNSKILGCSSAGEIHWGEVLDRSLSISIVQFEKTQVKLFSLPIESADLSFKSGESLATELNAGPLRAIIVLSEGLGVNGSELIKGINSVVDKDVVVTGGLAGDGDRFTKTWVLLDGTPQSKAVSAIALYGEHVVVGHGSQGGWSAFGPKRTVTRSRANVLYELSGEPALKVYKQYLGDQAQGLPASALLFPLAIQDPNDETKKIVRTVLAVDENDQSMTFAGDIAEGVIAQLMRANFDSLVEGAFDAATMAKEMIQDSEALCISISCVGRRLLLKERAKDEVQATLKALPSKTHQIGFYSYGEISPYVKGESCDLHNQTMTITVIQED